MDHARGVYLEYILFLCIPFQKTVLVGGDSVVLCMLGVASGGGNTTRSNKSATRGIGAVNLKIHCTYGQIHTHCCTHTITSTSSITAMLVVFYDPTNRYYRCHSHTYLHLSRECVCVLCVTTRCRGGHREWGRWDGRGLQR